MLEALAYILPFLLIISIIVSFHEYGHYSVARLFKTRIERFSVGFGKILLRKKDKHGVEWCISALPLGGYVKFAGDENVTSMMPSTEELDAARKSITEREGAAAVNDYFHFKPLWQRALIIVAGPVFNFILAIAVYAVMAMAIGVTYVPTKVDYTEKGMPAEAAGFRHGDLITKVDGHVVKSSEDVVNLVVVRSDSRVPFEIVRDGQAMTVYATPMRRTYHDAAGNVAAKAGYLGLAFQRTPITYNVNPIEALGVGVRKTWQTLNQSLTYLSRIFVGKENGDQISSVLGMTKVTGDITVAVTQTEASLGEKSAMLGLFYLEMIAVISIGLGFFNLLPVPALDGGHLAFYAYQAVARKPVPQPVQNAAFRIAIVLILGLMLYAVWNDINRIGLVRAFGGLFS